MPHYVKTFDRIFQSTIWQEDSDTRIVWWTLLLLADQDGMVHSTVPGLAHTARVSLDACVRALERFKLPDKYSSTKEFEGRRIEEADGGWHILNFEKYRDMMSEDEQREKWRLRQQRKRERDRSPNVTLERDSHATSRSVTQDHDTTLHYTTKPPNPLADSNSKNQPLNPTDVALAICHANGIVGLEERGKFVDVLKAEAEVTKRTDLPVLGEEIMQAWLKHRATGKFPQSLSTFLANGLHRAAPKNGTKLANAVDEARRQLEEQTGKKK